MTQSLFEIDIEELTETDAKKLALQLIQQGQKKTKSEYQKAKTDIINGYNNATVLANSEGWTEKVETALTAATDLAKSSNPLVNGTTYDLRKKIIEKAPTQLKDKISATSKILNSIDMVIQTPLLKTFIATNPIASSISSVISTVSGLIGEGRGDDEVTSDHVKQFSADLGGIVETWEKLTLATNSLVAKVDVLREKQSVLKSLREESDIYIVTNIVHGEFSTEQSVSNYLAETGNNFAAQISSALDVDDEDYVTMHARLNGESEEGKRFREGLRLARLSTRLMKDAEELEEQFNAAVKFAKDDLSELFENESEKENIELGSPDMATSNWATQSNEKLNKAYQGLCADCSIEKGPDVFGRAKLITN